MAKLYHAWERGRNVYIRFTLLPGRLSTYGGIKMVEMASNGMPLASHCVRGQVCRKCTVDKLVVFKDNVHAMI